ncbi:MAG: acetylglutamate kinase, partial [Actinomycetota bacterium]
MIVVKFGGNALAQASENHWLDLIADYHKGGGRVVIIHGGGPQIDAELSLHGVPRNFVEGYRFTDGKTMQIVEMVLA